MKTAFGTLEQSDVVSSVASQTRKGKVDSSWAKYSCQIKKRTVSLLCLNYVGSRSHAKQQWFFYVGIVSTWHVCIPHDWVVNS